jgi:hypothetical protein
LEARIGRTDSASSSAAFMRALYWMHLRFSDRIPAIRRRARARKGDESHHRATFALLLETRRRGADGASARDLRVGVIKSRSRRSFSISTTAIAPKTERRRRGRPEDGGQRPVIVIAIRNLPAMDAHAFRRRRCRFRSGARPRILHSSRSGERPAGAVGVATGGCSARRGRFAFGQR